MLHQSGIDCDLSGCQGRGGNELESGVSLVVQKGSELVSQVYRDRNSPNKLPRQPEEWFLEVIIRLGRNFEVLNVLLSVESHRPGLHFPLL